MRIRTGSSLGVAAALGALAVAVSALGATDEKVLVCHGTASATNTLVLIEVSQSALNGHFDVQNGQLVATGHGKQNALDEWVKLDGSGRLLPRLPGSVQRDAWRRGVGDLPARSAAVGLLQPGAPTYRRERPMYRRLILMALTLVVAAGVGRRLRWPAAVTPRTRSCARKAAG